MVVGMRFQYVAKVLEAEASASDTIAERSAVQFVNIQENIETMITQCPIFANLPVPDVVAIKAT